MATHSSILAWRILPGGLQSMGSQRVGHNWRDWARKEEIIPFHKIPLLTSHQWSESLYAELADVRCTRKTVLASAPCNFSLQRVGTNKSKPEVEFFSIQGACLKGKAALSSGECRSSRTENLQPLIVPHLMASPLQGLIPDIELGEGDDCIEISAPRQDPAFLHTLSSPPKTFWKTEQKQWGNPKGWWELHSPCSPDYPAPLSPWTPWRARLSGVAPLWAG